MWSIEEDIKLLTEVLSSGRKWVAICKYLSADDCGLRRPEFAVKHRFEFLIRHGKTLKSEYKAKSVKIRKEMQSTHKISPNLK